MLTRQRKGTIATALTITGQGESVTFNVVYHNRRQSEVQAKLDAAIAAVDKPEADKTDEEKLGVAGVVMYLVESWETEYDLTPEGIKEMEDDRPGIMLGVISGFHDARKVEKAKN